MPLNQLSEKIFTIPNFLTLQECQQFITQSEDEGFDAATIFGVGGNRVNAGVRNNDRRMLKDTTLAAQLWQRLAPLNLPKIGDRQAFGLNEMFRFYRYTPGQRFRLHTDGRYIRNSKEVSELTFLVYLNENFSGGETAFLDLKVKPETGLGLIFYHNLAHEGRPVRKGTKYVLRSDVMYH